MRKGQAEIIIIAGIVILAVVAILFSFEGVTPPTPIPTGVAQVQRAVKESVTTLIKNGADEIIEISEAHGGYLSVAVVQNETSYTVPDHAFFLGEGVPYWQQCQNDISPSKQQATSFLEQGMKIYIENNIDQVRSNFGRDVQVDLSQLDVQANILDNKIDFTVTLPTTVDGYPMQPYQTSIPTNYGRIFTFAKNFARSSAQERFLDYFTIASIHLSSTLPTIGVLTHCGETIYLTPQQVRQGMEDAIRHTLANTLWWQNMPVNYQQPRVYAVQDVQGKTYPELDINLMLPDNFGLQSFSPILIANNRAILRGAFFFRIPACVSPYNHQYDFSYPVIVTVPDELTGNRFNIASLVNVVSDPRCVGSGGCNTYTTASACNSAQGCDWTGGAMGPGDCSAAFTSLPQACSPANLTCRARVTATDGTNPLPNANVIFGGCQAGTTDSFGVVDAPIKCGLNELIIYHSPQYDYVIKNATEFDINGTYTLVPIPNLTFHFREVEIAGDFPGFLPFSGLVVSTTQILPKNVPASYYKCTLFQPSGNKYTFVDVTSPEKQYSLINIDPNSYPYPPPDPAACDPNLGGNPSLCLSPLSVFESVTTTNIPSGPFTFDAELANPLTAQILGAFRTPNPFTIPALNTDIYLYTPRIVPSGQALTQAQKIEQATDLASNCQIQPVTQTSYPTTTYNIPGACTCSKLFKVANNIKNSFSCVSQANINSWFSISPLGCDPTDPNCIYTCTPSTVVTAIQNQCSDLRITGACS